jgi:tight adherence protein B
MTDPVLICGLVLILAAILICFKLVAPGLKQKSQNSQSAQGINDAKARMVESTSHLIEKRSGNNLQLKLEKSGSRLRSGEWLLGVVAATVVLASLGLLRGGLVVIVLMLVIVPVVSWFLLNRKIQKRQDAFADQLPDLLQTLSSSLRSGQSLPQSIAAMAPDMSAPAGDELRRVVIENRIGRDLIESFKALAGRMDSLDFDWVVRAIEINHHTGGDLSVILRRLDATIRARNQVAGAVRSLTAEGRISGIVLSALPPGLMLAVQFLNPEFMEPMFSTSTGKLLLVIGSAQLIVGSFWLSRMARFKF